MRQYFKYLIFSPFKFNIRTMREHILYMADNPSSDAFYFSRRFAVIDISSPDKKVDETGLLALTGNKIVLGEPGLGKSKVMEELARQIGIKPVTAIRFINAKNPQRLVHVGKPLLIDGLDEAMSRREGDAVDAILAQLEEAGSPAFILSCRSREWQARNLTTLRQLYDADPTIVTLEPLDRTEAYHYLAMQNPDVDANHVLDHLATHNLDELYRNPLTLNLMGRVAERDRSLPATRGALFERAALLFGLSTTLIDKIASWRSSPNTKHSMLLERSPPARYSPARKPPALLGLRKLGRATFGSSRLKHCRRPRLRR